MPHTLNSPLKTGLSPEIGPPFSRAATSWNSPSRGFCDDSPMSPLAKAISRDHALLTKLLILSKNYEALWPELQKKNVVLSSFIYI